MALKNDGNRVDHMEERISELKDRNWEMIQVKEEQELSLFLFNPPKTDFIYTCMHMSFMC